MSRMADAPPRPHSTPNTRFEEPPSPYSRHPQYRSFSQESMERNNAHSMSRAPSSRGSSSSRSPSPRHRSRHRRRRRHYSDYSRSPSPRHHRRRRYSSSDYSRSPSPRRSRRGSSRATSVVDDEEPEKIEKPWYKKKSVWATVASVASVAALVPTSFAAKASNKAAAASTMAAKGSIRSANAVERSTNAVINTARGSGHQDHRGRYTGDEKKEEEEKEREPEPRRSRGYDRRNRGGACRHERPLLEYEPLRRALASGDYAMGYSRA